MTNKNNGTDFNVCFFVHDQKKSSSVCPMQINVILLFLYVISVLKVWYYSKFYFS